MNSLSLSAVTVALVTLLPTAFAELCEIKFEESLRWRRHPDDCSSAYICLLGRVATYVCPEDFVIGSDDVTCVLRGSESDDCSSLENIALLDVPIKELKTDETCKKGERSPDENNCAKFSECITLPDGNTTLVPQECPYPQLFDVQTGKCEDYKDVECLVGQEIPKSPCDYVAEQCTSSHCVPCNIRFPSCVGLPDGMNPWAGREWSPYYVVCEEERVIVQDQCESEKEPQVFHPKDRNCVEYDPTKMFG
ncbi:chitin binding [Mactra antiquata]